MVDDDEDEDVEEEDGDAEGKSDELCDDLLSYKKEKKEQEPLRIINYKQEKVANVD